MAGPFVLEGAVSLSASELARRLAREAEAVCRRYLSNGRRQGAYWLVGDVRNTPGRSMFVRLKETAKGPAGKWVDAATSEHGDLLDIIRESRSLVDFKDVADEARSFLALPRSEPGPIAMRPWSPRSNAPTRSSEAARRLFAMSQPIERTPVEAYLRRRGITALQGTGSLRFHTRCYYRPDEHSATETWPAMIAAVTDLSGSVTGAHRTWLDPAGFSEAMLGKAPIDQPRRAMGDLLGHAVRFGVAGDVLAAGEGIETMLSLRCVLPSMPMVAALSAAHLAAILFPDTLRRLYIARDNDPAGDGATATLIDRAQSVGIEVLVLSPALCDFNEDLRLLGIDALRAAVRFRSPRRTSRVSWSSRPSRSARSDAATSSSSSRRSCFPSLRKGPRPRPSQRAIGRQAARTGNGCGQRFSGAAQRAAFHREAKSPAFAILRQGFGPSLRLRVQVHAA